MLLNWLRHIKKRDFHFILGGFFGLIVLTTLFLTKCTVDQEQREVAVQQARREQQLHNERRRAMEAQQRREAEQKKRDEQARLRQAKLTQLKVLGVRGVPIHAAQHDPFRTYGAWLKVHSEPAGADVYFNWAHKGKTPLWLSSTQISGMLLITADDREAWFHHVTPDKNGALAAHLSEKKSHPRTQLLLTLADGSPQNAFPFLRSRLSDDGFIIPEAAAAADFKHMEQAAGGLSNDALRAWARSKFAADVLLRASVRERNRDIGAQSRVLKGTVRVFVDLDFDLYDLTTGEHRALITTAASSFALDRTHGFQKALGAATADAVHKLQARLAP